MKNDISRLLAKFMDGTTTLEEEDRLSTYFSRDDVPAEWEEYRLLFAELEAMKPRQGSRRRWLRWSAAAAVVVGVAMVGMMPRHTEPTELLAIERDTVRVLRPEPPNQETVADSALMMRQLEQRYPSRKRRLRKTEPTMTDLDKAYALMAVAEQERMEAEEQIEQVRMEMIHAQLTAAGYTAVKQEDGSIMYINEQTDFLTYEE